MASGTLTNDHDRAATLRRLNRLRPDSLALWGTLDAPRMLCHVADQLRVALGDMPCRPAHNFVSRTLVKFLVIGTGFEPPKGKIQTAPEMLASAPTTWDADLAACIALVDRVAAGSPSAVHPAFGPLTPAEWGKLCFKHLDHHLRQFGV